MQSAGEAWNEMSVAQQREIKTACVMVALGPVVQSHISSLVYTMRAVLENEIKKLSAKSQKNSNEEKLLSFLQEVSRAPASLDGIRTLEGMRSKAENLPGLFQIAERCFNALPGVLQFPGFVSLITHNAVSKFISFAISWRYTGKGYEPPGGMSAPFSGYDEIINSLIGHPRCKAEMEKQARLWEKAHE